MPEIKDTLIDLNPWWKSEWAVDYKERDIYRDIRKFLALPQVVSLTGLRRVGKTTLMFKIAADRIAHGLDPTHILYFSFDEFQGVEIREILREYASLTTVDLDKGSCLVLLDEIQKLEGWENQLKTLYDRYRKTVKLIVSGSESLFIRQGSRETLAGRLFEFKVEPLSFHEYLTFRGVRFEPMDLYGRELANLFDEFVRTQGFPELVGIRDKGVLKKYVHESVIDRVVFRDLPTLLKLRDLGVLRSLLSIFVEEPGQLVDLSDLAGQLGVSRQTVSNYLTCLEESFLLRRLYNYSPSRRKVERKLKRYYPTVLSVDLLFKEDDHSRSKVFEWAVVMQSRGEFFWRDPYKHEVDIVLGNRKPIPVEVKYGKVGFEGLEAFMRKFRVNSGYVVTPDTEDKRNVGGKMISVVPAYKFLLRTMAAR